MNSVVRPAVLIFLVLTLITGVAYPVAVTLIAQGFFPHQANGSLIAAGADAEDAASDQQRVIIRDWWGRPDASDEEASKHAIGSELIGQQFTSPKYFWGRPSATGPAYNGGASTGSNFGPTNSAQLDAVKLRVDAFREAQDDDKSPIPVELVTASGSGLDPHISPAAADYQVPRIAKARGLGDYEVRRLVAEQTEGRTFGLFGEPRVNVLLLNLALDKLKSPEN
jgi:potassium-transporting ATPase KdpC subunit